MAYTIISQNNNTTTLSDGVNTITVPSRVNLTSGNFTIVEVNNNMATLEDGDGNVYRDIPCVVNLVDAGGGGGTVDKSKIVNADTIPTASADNAGYVYLYTGETDANYTHGYVYQNKVTTTYTDSITFDPASISGTTVTATAGALAGLCAEYGSGDITDIIKGTLTYDQSGGLLVFVGLDDTDTQVCTFQLYTQDYIDAGFTFTGTLADGDVINFAGTITESSSYAWERIDVQPAPEALPDQTDHSGKFLTTDGTDASWGTTVQDDTLNVKRNTGSSNMSHYIRLYNSYSTGNNYTALACRGGYELAIINYINGSTTQSGVVSSQIFRKNNTITPDSLGDSTHIWSRTYTEKLNNGNDITVPTVAGSMSVQVSTVPTADSTFEGQIYQYIGATDSTYTNGRFYKCVSDGGNPATYSWTRVDVQPAGGSLPSQTGNSGKFLTTNGTTVSWGAALQNKIDSSNQLILLSDKTTVGSQSILIGAFSYNVYGDNTVAIGDHCGANGNAAVAIGSAAMSDKNLTVSIGAYSNVNFGTVTQGTASTAVGANTKTDGDYSIALGNNAQSTATNAIQIGSAGATATTNSDANTLKVGNANGNFEIMDANGNLPADRLASTSGLADGNYRLRLTMASGVPTLSWVAE